MQAEEIRRRVLSEFYINIFDVFAMLYCYCEGRFGKGGLDLELTYGRVSTEAGVIANTVLPPLLESLDPLSPDRRRVVAAAAGEWGKEHELELRLYTLLKAIDNAYSGMSARSMNAANFPAVAQELNLDRELGVVLPNSIAPLVDVTRRGGKPLRSGQDKGEYLRDNIENLVCVRTAEGCELDFGVMNVSTRFCFPSKPWKIAFIPLIDETDKVRVTFRDSGDPMLKLFHFDGLSNEEEIAERAVVAMRGADELGATVVLFPELCVSEGVRRRIAERMGEKVLPLREDGGGWIVS